MHTYNKAGFYPISCNNEKQNITKTQTNGLIFCKELKGERLKSCNKGEQRSSRGEGDKVFSLKSLCKLSLSRRGYCTLQQQQHGVRETGRRATAMQLYMPSFHPT